MEQNTSFRREDSAERARRRRKMRRKRLKNLFLFCTVILVAAGSVIGARYCAAAALPPPEETAGPAEPENMQPEDAPPAVQAEEPVISTGEDTATAEAPSVPGLIPDTPAESDAAPEAEEPALYDYASPVPLSDPVDNSYFDDAVFIGDSRTEGLILNTGLSNATLYAYKGLTVDMLATSPVITKNGAKLSVLDALAETSFSKVYIMLGINETGWLYSSVFIESYGEVIDAIREIEPSAAIYVQQILPVSNEVSETHSYVKNEKIREYNTLLQEMAREKEVYFVDTASAVAADDGSLPEDAAVDGIHLKRAYCEQWLNYLKTHTAAN